MVGKLAGFLNHEQYDVQKPDLIYFGKNELYP